VHEYEIAIRDVYLLMFEPGDLAVADKLVTDDFVDHAAPPSGTVGPANLQATVRFLHGFLADIRYQITDVLIEGDRAAFRATMTARQVGEMFGFPATGQWFSEQQMHMVRLVGDRIAEHWACRDDLGALRELGHI
jgi:predicted ester cyclase